MRNRIQYGQSLILCSDSPSNRSNSGLLTGLRRIQDVNIDYSINRKRGKQVGSTNYFDDVVLNNLQIGCSFSYLYNNGQTEALIGLNVDGASGYATKYLTKKNQDRNYYIIFGSGNTNEPFEENSFVNSYDVCALGNCYLESYSFSARVGEPIRANAQLSALNMKMEEYSDNTTRYIPAVDTSLGYPPNTYKYTLNTGDFLNLNQDGRNNVTINPGDMLLTLPTGVIAPGMLFTGSATDSANLQSFELSFSIERNELYGFGSMYPKDKRAIFPVVGNASFSAIASEFQTGITHLINTSGEKQHHFTFVFKNQSGSIALQLEIENAKIDTQSFNEGIGGNAEISVSMSFPISDSAGFKLKTPPIILNHPNAGTGPLSMMATGNSTISYAWYNATGPTLVSSSRTFNPVANGDYFGTATNSFDTVRTRTVTKTV